MHELSLAQEIIELVQQHVPPDQRCDVRSVRVRVGRLSGVVVDSLEFCFGAMVSGEPLAAARLEIEQVPAQILCATCQRRSDIDGPVLACPCCHGTQVSVVSGRELDVVEVELEERVAKT